MNAEPVAVDGRMEIHPVEQVDARFFGSLYFSGGRVAQISSALDMKLGSYFELLGTEGRIQTRMQLTPDIMTIIAHDGKAEQEWSMDRIEMFALQSDRFVSHIQQGRSGIIDGAVAQAKVIDSLISSAEHNKRITF